MIYANSIETRMFSAILLSVCTQQIDEKNGRMGEHSPHSNVGQLKQRKERAIFWQYVLWDTFSGLLIVALF